LNNAASVRCPAKPHLLRQPSSVEQGGDSHRSVLPQQVAPGSEVPFFMANAADTIFSISLLPQSGQETALPDSLRRSISDTLPQSRHLKSYIGNFLLLDVSMATWT
jgi:hypothetical protein